MAGLLHFTVSRGVPTTVNFNPTGLGAPTICKQLLGSSAIVTLTRLVEGDATKRKKGLWINKNSIAKYI